MIIEKCTERDIINENHATNPKPGDLWQEMLSPICVVISVIGKNVVLCKTIKNVGKKDKDGLYSGWTWDLEKLDILNLDKFKQWLSYESNALKYWCDCKPGAHTWAVNAMSNKNDC